MSKRNGASRNGHAPAPTDELVPTADWQDSFSIGHVKRLPSGLVVRLRPVDVLTLAMTGEIPDRLTPVVAEMLFGAGESDDRELDAIESVFQIRRERVPLFDAICKAAILEPAIVDDPQKPGEISIDTLSMSDRVRVFTMVTQGVDPLRTFPDEPPAGMAVAPDRAETGPEAEPVIEGQSAA